MAIVLIGTNDFFAVDICFGTEADLLGAVPGVNSRCCQALLLLYRFAAAWVLSLRCSCASTHTKEGVHVHVHVHVHVMMEIETQQEGLW